MATLKLKPGVTYVPKRKVIIQAPVRSGHAAQSIRFDPFRKRQGYGKPSETSVNPKGAGSIPAPDSIPVKNTPQGKPRPSAHLVNYWSARKNREWEPSNVEMAAHLLPRDVLMQTAANIVRKDLGLRFEKVARQYPVVDPSRIKPVKERISLREKRGEDTLPVGLIERGMSPARRAAIRMLYEAGFFDVKSEK